MRHCLRFCLGLLLILQCQLFAHANQPVNGDWLGLNSPEQSLPPSRTGFNYRFEGTVQLDRFNPMVLVFNGSNTWQQADVTLLKQGREIFSKSVGIAHAEQPDFFLRHDVQLPPLNGEYQLQIDYASPFTIVAPQHLIWPLEQYGKQHIRVGGLTLMCLGVLLALFVHYTALSFTRVEKGVRYYAMFVGLNILFFANSSLVISQLLGWSVFELSYLPILFSNFIYILFVNSLLKIDKHGDRKLWLSSRVLLLLMLLSCATGIVKPEWANELNRVNVNLFLLYGLACGLKRAWQKDKVGIFFLLANLSFVVFGIFSTHSSSGNTQLFMQVEHIGLFGITLEALLLALVVAYKLYLGEKERKAYLEQSRRALSLARTDSLTGLANRFAFDSDIEDHPAGCLLAMIDLNDLKKYNDRFGHAKGDAYLRQFAKQLLKRVEAQGKLYRIGGDEFVVLSATLHEQELKLSLSEALQATIEAGFSHAAASLGVSVHQPEQSIGEWITLADQRMYQDKQQRRASKAELSQD